VSITDDKAYAVEQRLNALMGRVGLVDAGSNPEVVSGAGLVSNISGAIAQPSAASLPVTITGGSLTSIGFRQFPAGDNEAGSSQELFGSGFFTTGNPAPASGTFGVYWGGTGGTLIGSLAVPSLGPSLTSLGWFARATIVWVSTTNAEVCLEVGWHTSAGVGGSAVYFTNTNTTGLAVTAQNLSLAFQWGSTPGGQSLIADTFRCERVC
jgi:hypothetical protein